MWQSLIDACVDACQALYNQEIKADIVHIQKTNAQFRNEADLTVMVFPLVKFSRKAPEQTAQDIGNYLKNTVDYVEDFTVVKGFLNLKIASSFWILFLQRNFNDTRFSIQETDSSLAPIIVEYSSPNTNKPLHLGHIRNNLLGDSISRILKANGKNVLQVNLVNDRGIHICKSMLAWQKWGNGETPESSGLKGDKLVGKYYVLFDTHYKQQITELIGAGIGEEEAAKQAPLIQEAQTMLERWEAGDTQVRELWKRMNSWVYSGFDVSYASMGISFDKLYYECETYLLGKNVVQKGLADGVFYKKEDGSVWIDLTDEGLDEKLLLRANGTSVYMTQDLGTAVTRYEEIHPERMIYVVGNEQNYHFDVLKKVLKKMHYTWADSIRHFSYGMVELPEGKMKSREGKVVDADDLIAEVIETARQTTLELGKLENFDSEEALNLFRILGLGGLKYFILKVDPLKNMMFNPKESIDFTGNTGPFIQYTYARIQSLLRKSDKEIGALNVSSNININEEERELLHLCSDFDRILHLAAEELSPAHIANYTFELAKQYNQFYQRITVLKEDNQELREFRIALSHFTAIIIKNGMSLLGIEVPQRM